MERERETTKENHIKLIEDWFRCQNYSFFFVFIFSQRHEDPLTNVILVSWQHFGSLITKTVLCIVETETIELLACG